MGTNFRLKAYPVCASSKLYEFIFAREVILNIRNSKKHIARKLRCGNSVWDTYRFPLCSNKLKTVGGSEKEINGKNLLLIAMMKKLEAFVEAGRF